MRVPMISVSGHTFAKDSLTRAISFNGRDPLTNEKMERRQAFPNTNMELAIADWLKYSGHVLDEG
jgi:hypothetical protein